MLEVCLMVWGYTCESSLLAGMLAYTVRDCSGACLIGEGDGVVCLLRCSTSWCAFLGSVFAVVFTEVVNLLGRCDCCVGVLVGLFTGLICLMVCLVMRFLGRVPVSVMQCDS